MFPKSVSASSAVDHENKGDGMRTERVTLEVTHDLDARLADWIVEVVDESLGLMESVRVVEEAHFDDLAQVAMERDTAIRELSAEKMWRDNLAIQRNEIRDERDALKARVAELEAAAKLAPHANDDGGSNHAAQAAIREGREMASALREMWRLSREACYERAAERDAAIQRADRDSVKCSALADKVIGLRARVDELEARTSTAGEGSCAAPAASGLEQQGVSSGTSGAPACESGQNGRLEAAPPQPRGWLTGEERLALAAARTILDGGGRTNIGVTIAALLARSSPPEVVLPNVFDHIGLRPVYLWSDVIAALAAAGVAVKEVGRE
jgi:BMFP domain-containing protein YqiC